MLRLKNMIFLVKKDDRTKIGTCGFHCWNKEKSSAEVGYDLKEAFWGNGYMQEALKEIIAFAAKSMNIKRIDAVILEIRSIYIVSIRFTAQNKHNSCV